MSRPELVRVRETIHHGDYYNVREQWMEPTWVGFAALLDESPYNAHDDAADYARNPYTAKLFADLLATGAGELGWARYEVVGKTCSDGAHMFTYKTEIHSVCDHCGQCDGGI